MKKSWEELECHVESRVHLSYPTIALADQALSEFNGKSWPFETKRLRESTLTVQRGDKGHELQVDGVFLKEYSEKPVENTLERQLQMQEEQIKSSQPRKKSGGCIQVYRFIPSRKSSQQQGKIVVAKHLPSMSQEAMDALDAAHIQMDHPGRRGNHSFYLIF